MVPQIVQIQNKIFGIRGQKVMLDRDLAHLYGIETRILNQAVKRNVERFAGDDFIFQLTTDEIKECSRSQIASLNDGDESLRSQFVILNEGDECLRSQIVILNDGDESLRSQFATLNNGRGKHIKYAPFAFTELGIAMLSSVLNSPTAIEINRGIMRAFVAIRQFLAIPPAERLAVLEHEVKRLATNMEDAFADYNDINEDSRMQFELINKSLAEFQAYKKLTTKPRKVIGFTANRAATNADDAANAGDAAT